MNPLVTLFLGYGLALSMGIQSTDKFTKIIGLLLMIPGLIVLFYDRQKGENK